MRKPSYSLVTKLLSLWCANPDLRFPQVVDMVRYRAKEDGDWFYCENDEIEKILDELLDKPARK